MSAPLRRRALRAVGAALVAAWPVLLRAQPDEKPFSPFITSPEVTVLRMLALAKVGRDDHVIDLGSGDGRIPIVAATKFGASGFGVDLDARLVELSNRDAQGAGVADRVRFERADVFATDVRKATVVTLYLLPPIVQGLRAGLLRQLRPGSRIVSHDFPFEGWQADASETFFAPEKNNGRGGDSTIFLYIVPANVAGRWQLVLSGEAPEAAAAGSTELRVLQNNQLLDAEIAFGRQSFAVRDGSVSGERVRFTAALPERAGGAPVRPWLFDGRAEGDTMSGVARSDRGDTLRWQARRTSGRS
jgi:hypothetical protein